MKIFFAFFIALLLPTLLFAAPTVPKDKVWFTPTDAIVGEAIEINAFIYNPQKESITFTVAFLANEKAIGTKTILVPTLTAKTISVSWSVPDTQTLITIDVQKALNAAKKDIPTLHGSLGTVSIGEIVAITPAISLSDTSSIKVWIKANLHEIEVFREKQAKYFIEMREAAKIRLGINKVKNIEDKYQSSLNTPGGTTPKSLPPGESENNGNDYINLIYSTSLASFFGKIEIFYISIVLLILLLLRFFIKLFV